MGGKTTDTVAAKHVYWHKNVLICLMKDKGTTTVFLRGLKKKVSRGVLVNILWQTSKPS